MFQYVQNIVAFIPARSQSKSIKDKNIRELGGKPLLIWSVESSLACGLRTIVNSDSQQYLEIAKKYGAEAMLRPVRLAKDDTAMFDVLKSEIPKTGADIVLLLQPTSPLRKKLHIKLAIDSFSSNLDRYDSLISAERVPEKWNPYAMIIEIGREKKMLFRKLISWKEKLESLFTGRKFVGPELNGFPISQRMTRRQDMPTCWIPDAGIYLFKAENLLKGSIYGDNVMILETEGTLNINEENDFLRAEEYLKNKNGLLSS